jgi:D-alanine transaminase
MSRIAYINGRYRPAAEPGIAIEDRGFQFADAIYEVCAVFNGRLLDWGKHLWRLRRGLAALFIDGVPGDAALGQITARVLAANRIADGLVYIQISRGVARRDHAFPAATRPTVVISARPFDFAVRVAQQASGVALISLPDQRWARCDLKTTGLLANVLARQTARQAGAFEALLTDEAGIVTEGASSNAWIVDAAGTLITRDPGTAILPDVMRDTVLALAAQTQIAVSERAFTLADARCAREMFITSTTAPVLPVVRLDGAAVGDGRPGPIAARLAGVVWAEVQRQTGWRAG